MKPWQWAALPLRRYARFSGHAARPEFWWFHLLTIAVMLMAGSIDLAIDAKALTTGTPYVLIATTIALVLPWIAVAVRRLHDANYSWWAMLVIFLPYAGVFFLMWYLSRRGHFGENLFGPDPYGRLAGQALVEPIIRRSSAR